MPFPVKKKQIRNPEATRRRILESGERLFAERGFDGVSVDEIAVLAKANKRMLYHYFGNKEGLYVEVLREVFGRLAEMEVATLTEAEDVASGVRALFSSYFAFLRDHPEFVNLLMWENLNRGRFLEEHPNLLVKTPVVKELEALLRRGRSRGEIRPTINTRHLLVLLYSICFIYHANRYTMKHTVGLDLTDEGVRKKGLLQASEMVLHGLLAD